MLSTNVKDRLLKDAPAFKVQNTQACILGGIIFVYKKVDIVNDNNSFICIMSMSLLFHSSYITNKKTHLTASQLRYMILIRMTIIRILGSSFKFQLLL